MYSRSRRNLGTESKALKSFSVAEKVVAGRCQTELSHGVSCWCFFVLCRFQFSSGSFLENNTVSALSPHVRQ